MTNAQVFRWFCKEQGIMHLMYRMYHKIQPTKLFYGNEGIKNKYLTFDEYVNDMVCNYGFPRLLGRIIEAYKKKLFVGMQYDDFEELRKDIYNKFVKFDKKWEYFAKNNIQLSSPFKIGDVVKINNYLDDWKLKITNVDMYNEHAYGTIISDDHTWNGRVYGVRFSSIIGDNGNKIKLDYLIRRNRKIYHGVNTR